MKRAAFYLRGSTLDQRPENQLADLQQLAQQRGWTVVEQYTDHGFSGARARRPGLDRLLGDARCGHFDVVAVWACDRLARSTRHFLEVVDELNHLGIEFFSFAKVWTLRPARSSHHHSHQRRRRVGTQPDHRASESGDAESQARRRPHRPLAG